MKAIIAIIKGKIIAFECKDHPEHPNGEQLIRNDR